MSMKKGWKITWISLGSLVGLVLLLLGIAMWLIFTPSQLTKLVNHYIGNFLDCDAHFEYVDLTFISTYPDAGLVVKDVTLIKKIPGTPNDTLAHIGDVTLGIDLMAFLKDDELIVHQVIVDNVEANIYIDKEGRSNLAIVPPSTDTTPTQLPKLIDLKKIEVKNLNAKLKDERDGIDAELCDLELVVNGKVKDSDVAGKLQMVCNSLSGKRNVESGKTEAEIENLTLAADVDKKGLAARAVMELGGEKVALTMTDSTGVPSLATVLEGLVVDLNAASNKGSLEGGLALLLTGGTLDLAGQPMVNETLQKSQLPLLETQIPFRYNMINKKLSIKESTVNITDIGLLVGGEVVLDSSMLVDVTLASDGEWQLKRVLSMIPKNYASFLKKMQVDGKVHLKVAAKGEVSDSAIPVVDANVRVREGRYADTTMLPYNLFGVSGKVAAHLDMNKGGVSSAKVDNLRVKANESQILLSGRADDLMGNMRVAGDLTADVPLDNIAPLLPEDMELQAEGNATLDAKVKFSMKDLATKNFEKMLVAANLKLRETNIDFEGVEASFPEMNVVVAMPAQQQDGKLADVRISGGGDGNLMMEVGPARLESECRKFDIMLAVNDVIKNAIEADFSFAMGESEAALDETTLSTGGLQLKGSIKQDNTKDGLLSQFTPRLGFTTHNTTFFTPGLPEALKLTDLDVKCNEKECEILSAQLMMGHTDLDIFGKIENIEEWLDDEELLTGYLNLTSDYADVDQLMNLFSGVGSDADELEEMRKEDTVPADATPFIVPRNVDFTVNTHIKRSVAFGNDLRDLSGELTVKDGVAVLDQMGFVCKAARMQLTAIYKSPRPNNLFTSIDFHLLDIQIDELLDMIPCIDTLVPMLKAFNGNADFHLAGETFLDARYQPKMSSLLGSAAISGKDLVVFDDKSLSRTAKLLGLKSWKDNDNKIRIDSMDVEMTCFRKEIEVYPFLLNMGSYKFCLSGTHNLDNLCNYHIEMLKSPLIVRLAVDIKGTFSDPSISLGSVRYSDFYKPEKKKAATKKALELKAMIRKELERNVR